MNEHDIKLKIMIELSKRGCKVFNRPTFQVYQKIKKADKDEYIPLKIGHKGQSDLSGHRPDGKAFYIETKRPDGKGKISEEQIKFIEAMKNSGALAGFAKNIEEAIDIVF